MTFIEVLYTLGLWLFFTPAVYLAGSFFSESIEEDDRILKGCLTMALGLGLVGYGLVALSFCKALRPLPVGIFLGLIWFLQIRHLRPFFKWIAEVFDTVFRPSDFSVTSFLKGFFLLWALLTAWLCLLPEIANDSLAYHLYFPKLFVRHNTFQPFIYEEKSYRTLFMECLYTLGILFQSVPTAKFFHWLTALLVSVSMVRISMRQTGSPGVSLFLGIIFWLTPTLLNQSPTTYSDAGTAFFTLLSCHLFFQGFHNRRLTSFFISGILMGLAISTKLLALMAAFALGLWVLVLIVTGRERDYRFVGKLSALFTAGALLTCGFWLIRNLAAVGNPVYPFFTKRFGTSGLYADQKFLEMGVSRNPLTFLLLPILVVFLPDPFNRHFWAGPFYLLAFPFALIGGRMKEGRPFLFVSTVVSLLWFLTGQDIRFILQIFPLALICTGLGIVWFLRRYPRAILFSRIVCGFMLIFYSGLGIYHYRIHFAALIGRWEPAVYLTKLERSYGLAQRINAELPADAQVFAAMEYRKYYFDREIIDGAMFYRLHPGLQDQPPESLIKLLKSRGATHILRVALVGETETEAKYRILDQALKNPALTLPLFQMQSENIRESQFIYSVYRIK